MIYLKYSRPGVPETDLATGAKRITIGASSASVAQIDGEGVQEQHAEIDASTLRIAEYAGADLLKVNGAQVSTTILESGDVISIGNWTMRFFHTNEEYVSEKDTRTHKVASIHSTLDRK